MATFSGRSQLSDNATLVTRNTRVKNMLKMSWISVLTVFVFVVNTPNVLATISVVSDLTNETVAIMSDQPARFIPDEDAFYDIQGYVIYADPPSACTPVKPPPTLPYHVHWILLARRYDCDFQTKIENAQNASYYAIIVHNVGLNSTEAMGVSDASKLNIFAVFVGDYDGQLLRDNFTYTKGYSIRIQDDFSFNGYIIPFAIVIGVCFVVLLLFMVWQQVIRWIRERRRNRKRRLPASALKKLPTQKWTKGDPYETCAICIEDFVVHDKIRVLPCSHGFHTVCIDPWLTKGRRVCPICKRKVVLAEERFSDSDSDSESETAPLLGASTSATQPPSQMGGSTFVQQRENPFRRAQRRQRTRPPQRSVTIQDTESSTENEDDEYASSSDLSQSNESSGSHKSILAEVHSSQNNAPVSRPCVVNCIRAGGRNFSSAPAHFAIESTSHVFPAAAHNDDTSVMIADPEEPEFASEVHPVSVPVQNLPGSSSQPINETDTGTGTAEKKSGHSLRNVDVEDPIVVNVTTSCNSQDFSDIPPDLSTSPSSSSANLNQAHGPKSNPFKSNNAIV